MPYNCKIIEVDDQPVVTIRTITAVENLPNSLEKRVEALRVTWENWVSSQWVCHSQPITIWI